MTAVSKSRVASLGTGAVVLVTCLTALGSPARAQPNTPLTAEIDFSTTVRSTITMATRNPQTGSLDFYWNTNDGSGGWGRSTASASVSSEPAIAVGGNTTRIAATGPGGTLDFYWNVNGSSNWNRATVRVPAPWSEARP